MRVLHGNIWDYHSPLCWVVIPTNTCYKKSGLPPIREAIMGAGLAREAAERYPWLKEFYGEKLLEGQEIVAINGHNLILIPTKNSWSEPSKLSLIEDGCQWLRDKTPSDLQVALPALGCGLGQLSLEVVKPILDTYLAEDRFILVLR